jgi:hypothetical protein
MVLYVLGKKFSFEPHDYGMKEKEYFSCDRKVGEMSQLECHDSISEYKQSDCNIICPNGEVGFKKIYSSNQ